MDLDGSNSSSATSPISSPQEVAWLQQATMAVVTTQQQAQQLLHFTNEPIDLSTMAQLPTYWGDPRQMPQGETSIDRRMSAPSWLAPGVPPRYQNQMLHDPRYSSLQTSASAPPQAAVEEYRLTTGVPPEPQANITKTTSPQLHQNKFPAKTSPPASTRRIAPAYSDAHYTVFSISEKHSSTSTPSTSSTSPSTSRRAAQNRAAQRAFRQRKIQYVKDLEAKARELESMREGYQKLREENQILRERLRLLEQGQKEVGGRVFLMVTTKTNHQQRV
ncbi:uncharacterized protein VTP21DRAFT_111 [Calcarisporiella thermophila]|uniref:uncharacterized protein n=1 Tax=Calcarisporiella thermophila TaxID=911321 RepID=UPI003743F928